MVSALREWRSVVLGTKSQGAALQGVQVWSRMFRTTVEGQAIGIETWLYGSRLS